jgi:hypothetical protein
MDEGRLTSALSRAEKAIERIERAVRDSRQSVERDEALRTRVRDAVAELDQLIREAS